MVHGKRVGKTSGMILSIKEQWQKAPSCPTLKTPLPQQSSSSAREEEEDHWVLMEDRRRRGIAFEKLAKEMLRYRDDSDVVKVGITELQERVEVAAHIGTSIQQVAQQAMNEDGQNIFEVFWQGPGGKRSGKA